MEEKSRLKFLKEQKILYVEPNPEKGFNVGYFLKWQQLDKSNPLEFFVEGNNGKPRDEYESTKNKTQDDIVKYFNFHDMVTYGMNNYVVLMPVFMRPKKCVENGNWSNVDYRALTSEAIWSDDKFNKRVDLQLLAMIKDAKELLNAENIESKNKVIMVGFSDSANFAQRFAFLHPEVINGVFIGGMNALAPIPLKTYKGEVLNYPLGTNDYKKLTGHEFDANTYASITQFFLLGDKDENDIVPFRDCITTEEQKTIEKIYGKDMQTDRWDNMKKSLKECGLKNIHCYKIEGIGHELSPSLMQPFVKQFFDELKTNQNIKQQQVFKKNE